MTSVIQVEQDENRKEDSRAGKVSISYDGGLTYEEIVGCSLEIDWDSIEGLGEPMEVSVGYVVSATTGELSYLSPLITGQSLGIVNHHNVSELNRVHGVAMDKIEAEIDKALRAVSVGYGDRILICASDEIAPMVQKCIDALEKEHYAMLSNSGGAPGSGKGKAAHKRKQRKMFGGW